MSPTKENDSYPDREYINLVKRIIQDGISKTDRTGTGTISLPFQQMRFDLRDNKIPLLTTKKMFTKGVIHEILWYLQGNTSSVELERHGVNIWQEWKDQDGELGFVYGHQWRSWSSSNSVVEVQPRIESLNIEAPITFPQRMHDTTSTDSFVGRLFDTKECGRVRVLCLTTVDEKHKDHSYDIQFVQTGYVKHNVRSSVIRRGHIIDPYMPRIYGVGYLGDYDKDDPNEKTLRRRWYHILERCYDKSAPEYQLYGGSGVFVHHHWHCYATFQREVKYLANWNNARLNPALFDIDKDYYSSNCYSKETCVWLSRADNTLYRKNPKPFVVTTPDGKEFTELSTERVCERFGLTRSLVYKVLNGKAAHHKKFTFKYIDTDKIYRYSLPIDQVASCVHKLRTNPTDRRIIISAWNVGELDVMRLPPCHAFVQFWSDGQGNLSSHLYQRSCDVGLGVPFNIVQYAILTHMFAHVTGHTAKEFVWTGGDVHIYNNHIDALKEQIKREPFVAPKLVLNPDVKEINDFKFDDFQIIGYNSHPTIKMEVSV